MPRFPKPAAILKHSGRGAAAAVVAAALMMAPATAEETTVSAPIHAGSLHDGPLDMVALYLPVAGGALEVTATFAAHIEDDPEPVPMRIVTALEDGDTVAFAMPGYPRALYRFQRAGEAVSVAVRQVRPSWL